jgi:hypothetical protein
MFDLAKAISIREEIESRLKTEYLNVFGKIRPGISDEAAARMTNAIMVNTDYVLQYKAEMFLNACPEFETADKLILPPMKAKAIEDVVNKNATNSTEPPAPKVDPTDRRPDDHPCKTCKDDKHCLVTESCERWQAYQRSFNVSTVPTGPDPEASKTPAALAAPPMTQKQIYESQPKGPAVPAAPKAVPVDPAKAEEDNGPKLKIVNCTVCGTPCERRPSVNYPGKFVKFCKVCNANRRKDGSPVPPKGA